jgi:hypothetical protein
MQFRVFYMRPDFFGVFIHGDALPDVAKLAETHVELRTVEAASLDAVYNEQQAHNWGEDWQATNALLDTKGLQHTSMSIGDVIQNVETGEFFVVAFVGFTPLTKPKSFYKTVYTFEVLSEEPLEGPFDLADLDRMTDEGDCVGRFTNTEQTELTAKEVAAALIAFGSEPGFFQLDDMGNDLSE